jgi:hypothetical protein
MRPCGGGAGSRGASGKGEGAPWHHRERVGVGVLAALILAAGIDTATAAPVEHEFVEESFSDVFDCDGLTLRDDTMIRLHILVDARGPDGLGYLLENASGITMYTNPATGISVTATFRTLNKDVRVSDNGDGTLTILAFTT